MDTLARPIAHAPVPHNNCRRRPASEQPRRQREQRAIDEAQPAERRHDDEFVAQERQPAREPVGRASQAGVASAAPAAENSISAMFSYSRSSARAKPRRWPIRISRRKLIQAPAAVPSARPDDAEIGAESATFSDHD